MGKLSEVRIIKTPVLNDRRGNLSFLESRQQVPFDIKRIYYLYDVPSTLTRGGHAHYNLQQVIMAISGSFDIILDDGFNSQRIHLNSPNTCLVLPTMIWRELDNFSLGAVCLVLASEYYSAADYIRNYSDFIGLVNPSKDKVA